MNTKLARQRIAFLLASLLILGSVVFIGPDTTSASGTVTTYSAPSGAPVSADFGLSAQGSPVDLYDAGDNPWGTPVTYGYFELSGGAVNVSINVNFPFTTYKLIPDSLGISSTRSGSTISFTLHEPTHVTLVLDENYQGKVLHLFAETPDTNVPSASDPDVLYYGPGYHDESGSPIMLTSGQTLYIAGGAILRARVIVKDATNVTIRGRGILLNDYHSNDTYDDVALVLKNSSNVQIKDVILNRNYGVWTAFMQGCHNITVQNYKVVSPRYASTDGFNIINSHDVLFDNVFIRSSDDAVSIKGYTNQGYHSYIDPATMAPNYNITYKNSQLWSDANNVIGVGQETLASYYNNILFQNIDILHHYDDKTYPDELTERSAINIVMLNGTVMKNITFKDIRVEKAKRLINIDIRDSFWFGSIQGNQAWPGYIENITYDNITSTSDGSNEIRMAGWNQSKNIRGVELRNIQINGQYVENWNDPHFNVNAYTSDVTLISPTGTEWLPRGPLGEGVNGDSIHTYKAARDYSVLQDTNGWHYRTWAAGIGFQDMAWNPDGSHYWRGTNTWDSLWAVPEHILVHPDQNQVLLEWTAPMHGLVNVSGIVKKWDTAGGDGVLVSIWNNNTNVWPGNGGWQNIAYDDSAGATYDVTTYVSEGDVISFRLDPGNTIAYDTTAWSPVITYPY
ncbi:glycosyl hydrolase family 28 protein [Paenibacillus sp. J5C_2022]|nr:glycosyl hydrolase family 28 protein [Paenibacillus sp. J5C2022]